MKLNEAFRKVFPEKCLYRFGFNRCGINRYPTEPHAFNDLNPVDREDAKENRYGPCDQGASCFPLYSKKFRRELKWTRRAAKHIGVKN